MNREEKKNNWIYFLLPLLGTVFTAGYILAAAEDVAYSDYIRLINSYLPDIWDPKKFFVADIFTRMPVNFLERIVNVSIFGYSTYFDMTLGVLCLGASALVLSGYCKERRIGMGWYLLLMGVLFSLNKWEMLTNGTGWCHFLAFAGFYFHYRVFERVWRREQSSWESGEMEESSPESEGKRESFWEGKGKQEPFWESRGEKKSSWESREMEDVFWEGGRIKGIKKDSSRREEIIEEERLAEKKKAAREKEIRKDKRDRRLLNVLPWAITLGTAGPYCGSYSAVLLLTYGICFVLDRKREGKEKWDFRYLAYGFHVVCPLILYLISNSFAVTEHAGTTGRTIGQVLGDNLSLFPKFVIKSLSSMVVGEEVMMEQLEKLNMGMALCYLAGALVLAGYLLALWMQLRERLYQVSVFPLMLIFAGGLNHLLVLAARWIFENSSYGMSSRYALQYQVGIFGIVLTFGLFYQVRQTREQELRFLQREGMGRQELGPLRRGNADVQDLRRLRQRKAKGSFWILLAKWAALSISLAILAGNGYTTVKELEKAPHRKAYGMKVAEAALNYREVADDELEALFQYRHGPEKIRNALRILEENGWNVYRGR